MKKVFLIITAMVTSVLFTSCQDNFDNTPVYTVYTYATVCQDDSLATGLYFETDGRETFYITENNSSTKFDELDNGDRVVAVVVIEDSEKEEFDYSARLFNLYDVILGDVVTVETEEQSDDIADVKLSYVLNQLTLYKGYLNLYVGYATEDVDNAKFYLVENLATDPDLSVDGYTSLELRYDNASTIEEDVTAIDSKVHEGYLSFDVGPLRDKLEDKKGVVLRIKTEKSGTVNIKIDATYLFEEE